MSASVAAFEVTPAVAQAVIANRAKMKHETPVEKWHHDIWGNMANFCAAQAGLPLPADFDRRFYSPGSWTVPSDSAKTCEALSKPPNTFCANVVGIGKPFVLPTGLFRALQRSYAFLGSDVQDGVLVEFSAQCELVRGERATLQTYTGAAKFKWLEQPTFMTLQTAQGAMQAKVGTFVLLTDLPGADRPMRVLLQP